jgi:RNA polymerase sigma-70 factor, ECF subfamily
MDWGENMQPAARSQTKSIKHGLSDLLADIAAGDKSAFAKLYGMTTRKLYGVALRIMRDRLAAEDVMQEAYFRVWRNAASFNPEVASPMTWMASIVRHCAIDTLRKQKLETVEYSEESTSIAAEVIDPAAEIETAQRRAIAFAALKKLSPEKRKLILQAYFRGQSRNSLARVHGMPTNTVKTHLRRTLIELREHIPRHGRRAQVVPRRGGEVA